jgi:hypothetical protein|tara:strand:- start:1718 stop:2503 length:786 start_codon:yes stop_codon:yes gene_type:complete
MSNFKEWAIVGVVVAFIALGAGINTILGQAQELKREEASQVGNLTLKLLKPNLYSLTGGVGVGDCEKIVPLLPTTGVFTVILESPGGSLGDGVCLSSHFKARNVITVIRDTPVLDEDGTILYNPGHNTEMSNAMAKEGRERVVICASACSLLFLGGDERYLIGNVYLGIHSPRSSSPSGDSASSEAGAYQTAAQLLQFLQDRLMVDSDELRRLFISVPASSMYYLSPKHFKEAPWLMELATNYNNFFGFTGSNPRANLGDS